MLLTHAVPPPPPHTHPTPKAEMRLVSSPYFINIPGPSGGAGFPAQAATCQVRMSDVWAGILRAGSTPQENNSLFIIVI